MRVDLRQLNLDFGLPEDYYPNMKIQRAGERFAVWAQGQQLCVFDTFRDASEYVKRSCCLPC